MENEIVEEDSLSAGSTYFLVDRGSEIRAIAKEFIDANQWDGEDRSGSSDWVRLSPDELQEVVDDLLEYLLQENLIVVQN